MVIKMNDGINVIWASLFPYWFIRLDGQVDVNYAVISVIYCILSVELTLLPSRILQIRFPDNSTNCRCVSFCFKSMLSFRKSLPP